MPEKIWEIGASGWFYYKEKRNVISNLCGLGENTREEANRETIWLRIKG